jgi:SAM-dependent methyltransferase
MSLRWAPIDSGPRGFSSPVLTYHRPCPICGSLAARPFLELADFQFYTDDPSRPKRTTVRDVQCESCFAAFLNPVYSDVGFQILFAQAEQSYGATAGRASEEVAWLAERGLLADGAAVLDIGCYDGDLLAALPAGVRPMGVDIDARAIARGRERLGENAELVVGDFASFTVSAPPDLMTMFHVLEHLPQPVPILTRLREAAHAGSRLVIEVPVLEGHPTNDLVGLFTVQHTNHFSRRSLANCLARGGWRIVEWLHQSDYNGDRVLCEPTEPTPDVAGDAQDTVRVREVLMRWQRAVVDVIHSLEALREADRCIIWGGGMHVEHIYAATPFFQSRPQREYVIVDSDGAKQGHTWRGIDIHPPDVLAEHDADDVPVLVSTYGSQTDIAQAAMEHGVDAERVFTLYDELYIY